MGTETKPLWTTTREAMGKTWCVELWPDDVGIGGGEDTQTHSSHLGRTCFAEQWVRVLAARPFEGRDATLLHEIVHLVEKYSGVQLKGSDVEPFTESLYAFLRGFGLWNEFPWPDREGAASLSSDKGTGDDHMLLVPQEH